MTPGAGIFRTTLPTGFTAGGVNCGVRRYRPDLGIIISEVPCITTGVFTQNVCKAAPVSYCQQRLPATDIKAIITNSGQANAATGEQGVLNNQLMADTTAEMLSCSSSQVLTASTGVIGEQLSIKKIVDTIPTMINSVSNIAEKFALSILTTDLVPKTVHKEVMLSTGIVSIVGICKGSGMIHPNMATMLGYLLTDTQLTVEQSKQLVKTASDKSFNMISVDGDTSTNDCVFLMSNGMSGISINTKEDFQIFNTALDEVSIALAKSIARDGEGASRLIEVTVKGLDSEILAKKIARDVITSPLVKTAIYESANWGRILAKIGNHVLSPDSLNKCNIAMQQVTLYSNGKPVFDVDKYHLSRLMQNDTIAIAIDFFSGDHMAIAWGCDLTEKYVKINKEYA